MYSIADRQELTKRDMISLTIEAPAIARKIVPGQFVVVRVNETGERVPLTVAYRDAATGTITIIFQVVGKSTALLASLGVGDAIKDLCGPLGAPEHFEKVGTVVGIGGGSGIAVLHHLLDRPPGGRQPPHRHHRRAREGPPDPGGRDARALRRADRHHRRRQLRGCTAWSPTRSRRWSSARSASTRSLAVGPLVMMRAVTEMTRIYGIPTEVSLNPIMVDGTGMCGGCRCTVGGKTKFACVDGPHFDAFEVDFDELIQRNQMYGRDERTSLLTSIKAQ